MNRTIKKIAVLGSGVMGSRIACHFANIGCEVLLLDIVPDTLTEQEEKRGLTLNDKSVRNRIVSHSLESTLKSNPASVYHKKFQILISIGNFEDDMSKISECDWILEAVVEKLEIKHAVYEKVEQYRKQGSLISTNTSGIPIKMLENGRSEDFKKHFCGTHFFNPPRYLQLLEIIPGENTSKEIVDFYMSYGEKFLGKTTVLCKDTPAFIANRIGVFSIMNLFHTFQDFGLSISDVDLLTGTIIGRPKSATFRTSDVVGLDTLVKVAQGLKNAVPHDEQNAKFELPDFLSKMIENNLLGDKSGSGFYKKSKNKEGNKEILSLDINSMEYKETTKRKLEVISIVKSKDLNERIKILINDKTHVGEFYRKQFSALFNYVSNRIPEISDELYRIDEALKAGFGWEMGPFEYWDAIGLKNSFEIFGTELQPAPWVNDMLSAGFDTFYQIENGQKAFYNINSNSYIQIPGQENYIRLGNLRETKTIWKNKSLSIIDIGDGILNAEFHSTMNTIDGDTLNGLNKAIDLAEESYRGLVISNEGINFSAGANVGLIFMLAVEQEYEELAMAVKLFQNTSMRLRYSSIPVVAAPFNLCLGGGCELCMHSDMIVAHSETYTGLVEFGVGIIPAGGGTKEFALRLSDSFQEGDVELNTFRDKFLTIGQAKVSTSAYEAFDLGIFRKGIDRVVMNKNMLLSEAKKECLALADAGYTPPSMRKDIKVLGNQAIGLVYVGADSMYSGQYISEHDKKISEKLGYVLAGGELSEPTLVDEQYLLDLERKIFLELCTEKKTLERLQSIINGGKVLRN